MFVNIDPYNRLIQLWLISIFLLVIIIIIVGGLTRLTDSGLSITEWELFKGLIPPLSLDQWNFYFDEYKKIPEFKSINYDMSLTEFKVIYYWEYFHRLIARLIGLVSITIPVQIWVIKKVHGQTYRRMKARLIRLKWAGKSTRMGFLMSSCELIKNIRLVCQST